MLSHKESKAPCSAFDEFITTVLSQVHFPFDHRKIHDELASHIDDITDELMDEGVSEEEASVAAVQRMGNAEEIGKELNKIHNPVLGWIWIYSSLCLFITAVFAFCLLIVPLTSPFTVKKPINEINPNDILYHISVDKTCHIDTMVLTITDIIYDTDHTLHIFYKTYSSSLLIDSWNFPYLGTLTDEHKTEYYCSELSQTRAFIKYYDCRIRDFPETSTLLTITYDRFNRYYEFNIDLNSDTGQQSTAYGTMSAQRAQRMENSNESIR